MRYPDRLLITRDGTRGGVTTPSSGAYVPVAGGKVVLYDGHADVQDMRARPRGADGEPLGVPPGIVFLPDHKAAVIGTLQPNDAAVATLGGTGIVRTGVVETIRPLDDAIVLRWTT